MKYSVSEEEMFPVYSITRILEANQPGLELPPHLVEAYDEALVQFHEISEVLGVVIDREIERLHAEERNRPKRKRGRLTRDISPEEAAENYKRTHRVSGPPIPPDRLRALLSVDPRKE